jgi:large subunit ribosomal protein L18
MIRMKRRRENKTDYSARITLLKGDLPRIVFRKSNRYIIGGYVKSRGSQDEIILSVNSKELMKYGWTSYSIKNLPACYLTGILLGKKILEKKEDNELILDIGLIRNRPKSKIYSFVKGLKDVGLKVRCNEEILPEEKMIRGKDDKMFEKVRNNLDIHFKTLNKENKK